MKKIKEIFDRVDRVGKILQTGRISAFAAESSFFLVISIFPFLILLITVAGFFPLTVESVDKIPSEILPTVIKSIAEVLLDEAHSVKSGTLLITVSAVTALWSSSKGTYAIMRGLDYFSESYCRKSWIYRRAKACIFTLLMLVVLIFAFGLIVVGGRLGDWLCSSFKIENTTVTAFFSYRLVISLLVLTAAFLILYCLLPSRRVKPKKAFFGALFSAVGWICFSFVYSVYVEHLSATVYGSLTMLVFYMLWIYICIYIVFLGASFNRILDNRKSKNSIK